MRRCFVWLTTLGALALLISWPAATASAQEILVMRNGPIPVGGNDDVGALPVGVGTVVTYTVGNTDATDLHVQGVSTASATNCVVTVASATAFGVEPFDASPLELLIQPTALGPFGFDLEIASDDADENPFVVHVTGTATPGPTGALTVTGVTALEATQLDAPVSRPWVLENVGGGDLVITEIALGGVDAASFALSGLPSLPLTLGPAATAPLTLSFTTATGADASALVRVTSDTGGVVGTVTDVPVTGSYTPAAPEIDVRRVAPIPDGGTDELGDRAVGVPFELTFVIENQGNADLGLLGAEPAALGQPLNCAAVVLAQPGGPVAPGGTAEVVLEVTPEAAGAFGVSLTIDSDDEDESPYLITLVGNGVETAPPNLVVIGNTAFYAADVGYMDSSSWVLVNDGGTDLVITDVDVTGADSYAFSVSGLSFPATLAPGQEASLNVYFVAEHLGTASATVRIESNSGGSPGALTDMPVTGHVTGTVDDPGCNCRSSPAGGLPLGLVVALLLLVVRRRRR